MKTKSVSESRGFFILPLLLLALSVVPTAAHSADDRAGNGGDGIIMNGHLYLLDLVEAGVESSPRVRPPRAPSQIWMDSISQALDPSVFPVDLIVGKLREIESFSPGLALTYAKAIRAYHWAIVAPRLMDIQDEDSVIEFPGGRPVQLAVRRDGAIRIHREHWNRLSLAHRAALIFHEVSYALMPLSQRERRLPGYVACFRLPEGSGRRDCLAAMTEVEHYQSSAEARAYVGFLFSHDFETERALPGTTPFNILTLTAVTPAMLRGYTPYTKIDLAWYEIDSPQAMREHRLIRVGNLTLPGSIAMDAGTIDSIVNTACSGGLHGGYEFVLSPGYPASMTLTADYNLNANPSVPIYTAYPFRLQFQDAAQCPTALRAALERYVVIEPF